MNVAQTIIEAINGRPCEFPKIGVIYKLVIGEYVSKFGQTIFTGRVVSAIDGMDCLGTTFHDPNVTRLVKRLRKAMYIELPEDEALYELVWL